MSAIVLYLTMALMVWMSSAAPQSQPATTDRCTCFPDHLCDTSGKGNNHGESLISFRSGGETKTCQDFLNECNYVAPIVIKLYSETPKPCQELLDGCCANRNLRNRPTGCGILNVGGLNFSFTGKNTGKARFGEFPWTVALLKTSDHSYFGAGSLIHPRVVLTAAHKVKGKALDSFVIRAGEWDSQTTEEYLPYEERIPSYMITHHNYGSAPLINDFALIMLEEAVPMMAHISTVCLPPANFVQGSGQTCFSGGWGKDSFGQYGRHSVILKKVSLPIVPFDQCQEAFRKTHLGDRFVLDKSFVCAGGAGADTCECDGGAPLVCPTGRPGQRRYHQTGIVAWGIGCNNENPGVYASVSYARYWIDLQMRAMEFGTETYTAE